ncbi:polymorphic toxin type 50 domain-containing protein [Micromonospora sp. NPDC051196]|uniref:polymorphic toxin type 50 domain-containing protein n=1 Tax=Micromonospora sp. NPDC051196 TaxID=3155281 RepID=UPI00344A9FB0
MAVAVLLGLLPVVQLRGPAVAAGPVLEPGDSTSVASVAVRQQGQDPDPDDEVTVTDPLPAGMFPEGGEAVLDLQGDPEDREAFGLTVEPAGEAPAGEGVAGRGLAGGEVGSVRVRSFDRAASVALGNAGPLYALDRADGSAVAGAVQVVVDYADFAQAYGGSFADRLTLVRLPGCAATTPEVPECSADPVWVSATNDPYAKTLTAVVEVGGDATAAGSRTGVFEGFGPESTVESTGVYALASSASGGSTGSYTATDLKPSGSWQVGESAGSFTYSYPLPEPPLPYGQTLGLELSYSSSAVDGMTHGTNNQSGPAGLGWSYSPGYVERTYKPCRTHKTEMCWESPDGEDGETATNDAGASHITISLQGQSTQIVKTTAGVWKPVDDFGWRVEFLAGGAEDDGYWKVWTPDGTEYRFGFVRDSVWKMSFLGDEAGEPCYDVYPASCRDPWRWNLDRVRDANENETYLHWTRETNHYKRALSGSILEYDRGGYLSEIEYAKNVTEAGAVPVGRVVFGWAHRCVERTAEDDPFNNEPATCPALSSNPNSYPDVPGDLVCGSSSCGNYTQSFFTSRILDRVISYQWNAGTGEWNNIARVQLRYKVSNPTGLTERAFVLDYIRPSGLIGADTNKIDLPPVDFDYVDGVQPNFRDGRVDYDESGLGVSAMRMPRLLVVRNGFGGRTQVTYGTQKPCPQGGSTQSGYNSWHNGKVGNWDVNTEDCYPIFHSPPGADPGFGIFHKYLVKKVVVKDQVGGSPDQVTQYDYSVGNPAWKNPNNPLVPDAEETWSIFAGYNRVRVVQGSGTDPSKYTVWMSNFFRGMYHDIYDPGSGGGIKQTTVTDYAGDTYDDHYARAGRTLQTRHYRMTTYNANPANASYTEVASTRYDHVIQGSSNGPGYANPRQTRLGLESNRVKLDDGSWRTNEEKTIYESTYGLPIRFHQYNQVGVADNTCTSYTYAQQNAPNSYYMIGFPERVETWSGDTCGSGTLLSRTVTFYDTYTVEGSQAPFDGNVAETRVYSGPATYTSSGRSTYDNMGRIRTATDPAGLTTTTTYSPVVNWPDNGITSTVGGGYNHTTTTLIDRHTGRPSKITDPNGKVTELVYDPLGRFAEVYLPGQAKSSGIPSLRFSHQITSSGIGQPTAPARTKTETLQSNSGSPVYLTSYQYVDGVGQSRERQQPGPNGGRIVTATTYDGRGNVAATTEPFHNTSAAGSGLVSPSLASVPAIRETSYDHLNRATTEVDKKLGVAWRQTATTYHGDRVTVVPPIGGTKTVSHTDVRGNVTRLDQYTSATDPNAYQSTSYTFDLLDQLTKVVDSAGNTWTNTYDLAGRTTKKVDPDSGTSSIYYDTVGRVDYTLDGRERMVSIEYDAMSRTTARWAGRVGTGVKNASYLYDTIAKGRLTSSTRWHNGSAYTTAVTGYTDQYQPTGSTATIPAAEGSLAGTYTTGVTYNPAGQITSQTLPGIGGLPAETITSDYDSNGYLQSTIGQIAGIPDTRYLADLVYYSHGPTYQTVHGAPGSQVRHTTTIDPGTGRLNSHDVATERQSAPGVFDSRFASSYTYDQIGNITTIAGKTDGTTDQVECFTYDQLRRLTEAWTQTTTNCTNPQRAGADPYHRSWTFDALGNRLTQTDHNPTTGDTVWTYNVGAAHQVTAHQIASITASGPLAEASIRSFAYDNAGNTTHRTALTGATQTLTWNGEGRLDTITEDTDTTQYIYDAGGSRLISRAPDKTTLYLGSTELVLTPTSGGPLGTRYYAGIAVRDASGLKWTINNHQGTGQIQIDAGTLASQRRRSMPYGEQHGTAPSVWLGTTAFVGGTQDDTGLIHLGAREYDPSLGRFISVDPIMDPANPQQMHGYAYGNNSPITYSDPSGLYFEEGSHGEGQRGYVTKTSSGKNKIKVTGQPIKAKPIKDPEPATPKNVPTISIPEEKAQELREYIEMVIRQNPDTWNVATSNANKAIMVRVRNAMYGSPGWKDYWEALDGVVVSTVVATVGAILCPASAGVTCLVAVGALAGVAGQCMDGCADAQAVGLAAVLGAAGGKIPKIHPGKQGKHVPGHNNFDPTRGRSEFTHSDPQGLINQFAGTGARHGNKEVVDFRQHIGTWVGIDGTRLSTTRGTIHYGKDDVHIVPAHPTGRQ